MNLQYDLFGINLVLRLLKDENPAYTSRYTYVFTYVYIHICKHLSIYQHTHSIQYDLFVINLVLRLLKDEYPAYTASGNIHQLQGKII
jgi:hypothetical protein